MRIISGELRGRRLTTPKDDRVRPTTDKVKEAIFNIIQQYMDDSVVIDMFAGTGNLGLEAISRGARKAYFVDKDRRSIALVRDNVNYCKVGERAVILCYDYAAAVSRIHEKADIIFLDPPYGDGLYEDCVEKIVENDLLAPGGIIVAEHSAMEMLPEELSGLPMIKCRKYGKICVSIYENSEA